MKQEISPLGIVITVVVLLLIVGGLYYKMQQVPDGARPSASTTSGVGKTLPTASGLGGGQSGGKPLPSAQSTSAQ